MFTITITKGLIWPVHLLHVHQLHSFHSQCDNPHFAMSTKLWLGCDQLLHQLPTYPFEPAKLLHEWSKWEMCELLCVHVWLCFKDNCIVFMVLAQDFFFFFKHFCIYICIGVHASVISVHRVSVHTCMCACSICLWPCCETGDTAHQVCAWDTHTHTFPHKHQHASTPAHTRTHSGWPQTEAYRC